MNDLKEYMTSCRKLVDEALSKLIDSYADGPPDLVNAIRYSLLSPGKRLRPILSIMAATAAGGEEQDAVSAGCAVEMVHTYSLIHDDLPAMDDDDLRRGRATCHKVYGEAMAILAGDALLTLSFHVLCEEYPAAVAAQCCRELAAGAGPVGMVGGQVLDLAWEKRNDGQLLDLEKIHSLKTGALIQAALRMGVIAAQAGNPNPEQLSALDQFGQYFGLAFQVTDDLLDVNGHPDQAGKRVGKDAQRGKLTYPGLLGLDASRKMAESLIGQAQESVAVFGRSGACLAELAQSLLGRDR